MTSLLRIAFVDDDPHVLHGIARAMAPQEDEWDMVFCDSGADALARMAEQPFDVIVTDMRMPGMDGAELLTQVRAACPSTVRIILSGYAESEAVLRTIGPAHIYLAKPCNAAAVRQAIDRQLGLRAHLGNPQLRATLAGLTNLPSLPQIYLRLQAELLSPNSSARSIADIIAGDVPMTAELLKISNSAFFASAAGNISSPLAAISRLGIEIVQSLLLIAGIFRQFDGKPEIVPLLERLTQYGLEIAGLAEQIAVVEGGDATIVKAAQIAGMLSAIGCVVLLDAHPETYQTALSQVAPDKTLASVEEETFGANHAQIGAYLLGLWGFSDTIVEALAYCRTPSACPGRDNVTLTALHAAQALGPAFPLVGPDHQMAAALDMNYLISARRDGHVPRWRESADKKARKYT